jgi:hypothetical protein
MIVAIRRRYVDVSVIERKSRNATPNSAAKSVLVMSLKKKMNQIQNSLYGSIHFMR